MLLVVGLGLCIAGCAPSVSTTIENEREALDTAEPVGVTDDASFVEGEKVGTIRVKESGLSTNCSRAEVWSRMRDEARKAGANVVLITESNPPDFWSSCYRAEADFYHATTDVQKRVIDQEPQLREEESGNAALTVLGAVIGAVAGYFLASLIVGG